MIGKIRIPGLLYSFILAFLDWLVNWLTGHGSEIPWAPMAIVIIPALIKMVSVQMPPPDAPLSSIRGLDAVQPAQSKISKFLLG